VDENPAGRVKLCLEIATRTAIRPSPSLHRDHQRGGLARRLTLQIGQGGLRSAVWAPV